MPRTRRRLPNDALVHYMCKCRRTPCQAMVAEDTYTQGLCQAMHNDMHATILNNVGGWLTVQTHAWPHAHMQIRRTHGVHHANTRL